SWEQYERHQAALEFPARGRLLNIGGRRIQIDCRGTGSPTVVFESGLGIHGALSWAKVHDPVAKFTRACAPGSSGATRRMAPMTASVLRRIFMQRLPPPVKMDHSCWSDIRWEVLISPLREAFRRPSRGSSLCGCLTSRSTETYKSCTRKAAEILC